MSLLVLTSLLSVGVIPAAVATEVAAPEVVDAELDLAHVPTAEVAEVVVDGLEGPVGDPTPGQRSGVVTAPIEFTALWAELPTGLDAINVRTSVDGETWTPWFALERQDGLDAPDPGTEEAAAAVDAEAVGLTDLQVTLEGRHVQVEAPGEDLTGVTLGFIDGGGLNEGAVAKLVRHLTPRPVPAEAATVPAGVNSRASWGAAPFKGTPSVASNGVQQVVLHHTATQNNLRQADGTCSHDAVASTMRSMQSWHQNHNGWSDLGYNVVIDPCGGLWEGRAGGLDRAVIGAHAAGFNTGSTGISVIGTYSQLAPNADILRALDRVVGWKAGIHGIDTHGTVWRYSTSYPTVVGHRQVGQTSCPGRIMEHIERIRTNAKAESSKWDRVPDGAGATTAPRFTDVAGSPHAAAIEELVAREITTGYPDRTFRPLRDVTRAQVATFLSKALGLEPIPGARFNDVDPGFVHAGAINALVEAGILTGYAGNTFRPNEPLRREHMAVIITRALELDLNPEAAARFSDVIGYAGEIGAIADAGIASGRSDGTFLPKASVTRGQMATFLVNALHFLEERAADEEELAEPEPEPTDGTDAT
ncbi:S-layer homology domain-containing protein [Nitriliruptor alkaliphilus]|uniref:S-layer homology domain-containing protein n=1 Tax=Nitriliruptor alkaliphilus TaxID=427918 RepID=UPI0012ED6458|nr:S-layer homology domain-containing protein [Nitriliruptor alkaliphilus]